MVMVFLNWLYIAMTSFAMGYSVLSFFSRIFNRKVNSVLSAVLAGIVCNTVYAQLWSLFGGVGLAANIVLVLMSIASLVIFRNPICELLKERFADTKSVKALPFIYAIVLLIMLYGTSRGLIHYDTSLYHAQSIRWIEEYGVVKGLATLQLRFGYNSSAFALTALYSMAFMLGQSLHATAGFFALIGAIQVVDIYKVFTTKKVRHSDFIRLGFLFYLGLIYKEMVSPASDYYAQILIFTVIIMWLDALEENADVYVFAMLSILAVYASTVKFSIALLVLLVIKPAIILIKEKQIKQIVTCLSAGIVVLIPFFVRNVLISGWLIYPSTFINLFNPDWKIPKGLAQYDAMEIGVYGKGINDVTKLDMPISQWLPNWFKQMAVIEKGWVILTVLGLILGVAFIIYKLAKKEPDWDKFLVILVMFASCIFWFVSAPLVRYGYGYLICIPCLIDGCLCLEIVKNDNQKVLYYAYIVVFLCLALFRVKTMSYDIMSTAKEPYYIAQKDYIDWPVEKSEIGGYTMYIPQVDALSGYNQFPASLMDIEIELRGNDIKDGFRFVDYDEWVRKSGY